MTLELVNTLATCATFVVIAVTATAAIVQLRHMWAGNQIAAFNELRQAFESPNLAAAHKYIDTQLHRDLEDPAFRYAIAHRSARTGESHAAVKHLLNIGHFFETMGLLVKSNLVPSELVLATWSDVIVWCWKQLVPVTWIFRNRQDPVASENFEYIAVLAARWRQEHPSGTYPANMPRLPLEYPWADADFEYETSMQGAPISHGN
ncbi:MAG TPA: hypothetical protein VFL13_12475 [Candidatus Baltobacteraceae bacterium]|nr:hypothetical protein [Candidatus Baltobacteraceae bacterium]